MKAIHTAVMIVFCLVLTLFGTVTHSSPPVAAEGRLRAEEKRGVGMIGFPSLFHDIKHQFGSIGHDLRKLITSLMGATQVVYWKPPFRRQPVRRADTYHRQQTHVNRIPRLTTTTSQPTTRASRRKKAYTGDDVFDDFFSFDSFGFW